MNLKLSVRLRSWIGMLIVLVCWFSISPLMCIVNRKGGYFNERTVKIFAIISPFTWSLATILFIYVALPAIMEVFPSVEVFLGNELSSFPEFKNVMLYPDFRQVFLISYFLPVMLFV